MNRLTFDIVTAYHHVKWKGYGCLPTPIVRRLYERRARLEIALRRRPDGTYPRGIDRYDHVSDDHAVLGELLLRRSIRITAVSDLQVVHIVHAGEPPREAGVVVNNGRTYLAYAPEHYAGSQRLPSTYASLDRAAYALACHDFCVRRGITSSQPKKEGAHL